GARVLLLPAAQIAGVAVAVVVGAVRLTEPPPRALALPLGEVGGGLLLAGEPQQHLTRGRGDGARDELLLLRDRLDEDDVLQSEPRGRPRDLNALGDGFRCATHPSPPRQRGYRLQRPPPGSDPSQQE